MGLVLRLGSWTSGIGATKLLKNQSSKKGVSMKKYVSFILLFISFLHPDTLLAFTLRNTYPTKLKCIQVKKPHSIYIVSGKVKNDFSTVPSVTLKEAGKYNCKTTDKAYVSTCEVSEFQPQATFNTNDGSVSCSTPEKIKK